ncbi:MAG: chromophore lyase CpcT/CpeT [Rhodospirillaceae bacterium]
MRTAKCFSKRLVLTLGLALVLAAPVNAEERRYTLLERELEYLMEIWPGNFDNREQVQFDADMGKPDYESGAHLRVHGQVSRVDLPQFGEHILYVEEYKNDDPKDIFRQRLYELSADESENAIRIKLHFFNDEEKYLGAHDDPSLLQGLTRNDTTTIQGCDVFLRRDGASLTGGMKPGDCTSEESTDRVYSEYQVRVGDDGYAFRDHFVFADNGEEVNAVAGFQWHDLRRARWFQCMIDFPYETGKPAMYTEHYPRVHDQGGIFSFTHPDGRPMTLSMRNRWSYGMQRDSFVIKVHDGGEPAPDLVYAWGSPGDDRIGLNPGWIRVQCDLDTPLNRTLQKNLRPDS